MTSSKSKTVIIGFGGSTGSGKTSLCRVLAGMLPNCYMVSLDDFYCAAGNIQADKTNGVHNFESPSALQISRISTYLKDLSEGMEFKPVPKHVSMEDVEAGVVDPTTVEPAKQPERWSKTKRQEMLNNVLVLDEEMPHESRGGKPLLTGMAELAHLHHAMDDIEESNAEDSDADVRFIVVEGFLLYCDEMWDVLSKYFALRFHVAVDRATCQKRRLDRGTWLCDEPHYFNEYVWPYHVGNTPRELCFPEAVSTEALKTPVTIVHATRPNQKTRAAYPYPGVLPTAADAEDYFCITGEVDADYDLETQIDQASTIPFVRVNGLLNRDEVLRAALHGLFFAVDLATVIPEPQVGLAVPEIIASHAESLSRPPSP